KQIDPYEKVLNGRLCVPIYGSIRFPLKADEKSLLAVVDVKTGLNKYVPSPVFNLHGLLRPSKNNPNRQTLGIGHSSKTLMDVFDVNFERVKTLSFDGITFRGHGVDHDEGVLISAEKTGSPGHGGLLLLFDSDGK